MVVEDLHWIDPGSRHLLDLIIEHAANLPILPILTFRPDFQAPWNGVPQVTALILRRLARRSSGPMVMGVAGNNELPDALTAEIAERADGVALFVEELSRAVIKAGAGPSDEALADAAPPALRASLVARLDQLGPAAREAAQIGAVLGRDFPYDPLARLAQPARTEADLQAALAALTGAGLLLCRAAAPRSSRSVQARPGPARGFRDPCCGRAARNCIAPRRKPFAADGSRARGPAGIDRPSLVNLV
jgi:predicted ATPase